MNMDLDLLLKIVGVAGFVFSILGIYLSYATAKELKEIKLTNKEVHSHFSHYEQAMNLYKSTNNRIIACLTAWESRPEVLDFLKKTTINEIIFYGCFHKGTVISRILKRYYINSYREKNGLSPIQIFKKESFDLKYLLTDRDVLIAKKINTSDLSAELSVPFENFVAFNSFLHNHFQEKIRPKLIPFEVFLKKEIEEIGVSFEEIDLIGEKLLNGEKLDANMSKNEYLKYLKYAISKFE